MKIRQFLLALLLTLLCFSAAGGAGDPAVKNSQWNGYERLDFTVDGRACLLVLPKTPAIGRPWIWRTEFFGHEPQADLALLEKGFHAAYMDVQNMYGAPPAIAHMEKFHTYLTASHQLSALPVLEGFSRGGLFALNWVIAHPDRVSCLYLDAPVCDFKSWPAGFGKGKGSPGDWVRCKQIYGLASDEAARESKLSPLEQFEALAKAKIPILSVCGDADDVVPMVENSSLLKERCEKLGLTVTLITKPGVNHHPHSLKDPAPIVDFILKHTAAH